MCLKEYHKILQGNVVRVYTNHKIIGDLLQTSLIPPLAILRTGIMFLPTVSSDLQSWNIQFLLGLVIWMTIITITSVSVLELWLIFILWKYQRTILWLVMNVSLMWKMYFKDNKINTSTTYLSIDKDNRIMNLFLSIHMA